jgi:dienelactone hydrolase
MLRLPRHAANLRGVVIRLAMEDVIRSWQSRRDTAHVGMASTEARVLRPAEWDGMPPALEAISPDGRLVLSEDGPDLALRALGSGRRRRLTTTGTAARPWRANAQVFSVLPVPPTAIWSPDSTRIVTVHADVGDLPWLTIDTTTWPAPVERDASRGRAHLAVIDVHSGATTSVRLPHHVHWAPARWESRDSLLVFGFEFGGRLWLCRVEVASGEATVLVRERVPSVFPYLAAAYGAAVLPAAPHADALWISERGGDQRVHCVARGGLRPWTPPGIQVERVLTAGQNGLTVVARGDRRSPYRSTVLDVTATGEVSAHAPGPPDPPRGEEVCVPAADGHTELHGVLFKPPDFTNEHRYPVVLCVYGGPQTIAHQALAAHLWGSFPVVAEALARLGFVTAVVDARGTPGRGWEFHWPPARDRLSIVVADQIAALRALAASRPWMDLSRCGVVGTSLGAYFALRCALREPALFRAVAAHAGPYEPADALPGWFPGLLGASYDDDPDHYARAAIAPRVGQLDQPVLLLHGTADTNVPASQTRRLSRALGQAGRHHEVMWLDGERHHLSDSAASRALDAVGRFFLHHLAADDPR